MQLFTMEEPDQTVTEHDSCSSDEEVLLLSQCAVVGVQGKKTMKLQGLINNQEVLIMVDSGSSGTFISDRVVQSLHLPVAAISAIQVTVADGTKMRTDKAVSALEWWTHGYSFVSEAKVLQLGCYDLILGMDWLEQFSPMWVDWKRKKMRFNHMGQRITVTGIRDCTSTCLKVKGRKLNGMIRHGNIAQLVQLSHYQPQDRGQAIGVPLSIQQLVDQHAKLFQQPKELPQQRDFDHAITLIPGVQPVNVKPYRYGPTQKDEIERQVKEMLSNGVI